VSSEIILSIIIPAYNNPDKLEALCHSLHSQFNKEVEVLVIDDGSIISLRELVDRFGFSYFYKENSGPASSRNFGAKLSRGKYFLFLDSDTVMPEGMLEKILYAIKIGHAEICSIFYSEKSNNCGVGQQFKAYFDYFHNCHNVSEGKILSLQGSSCFFKKNVFDELGGWAENFLGATIENEEFANRINKDSRYEIIFKPDLNVSHNFQDLKGLLKTIFQRSIIWTQLKITKTIDFDGLVRTKKTAWVTLQSFFILVFLVFTVFSYLWLYLFATCLIIYFLGNLEFYIFLYKRCNFLDFASYNFVQYLFHLSVSLGAIIGLMTFKVYKFKY
jgi:glycosyltransferase involved in cell wall biosynthesis